MDARHEPFQQDILNHLINTINAYINNNTDHLVVNQKVQDLLKEICKPIYHYSNLDVDVDGILSKHNLLSIDVVFFPLVVVENKVLSESDFRHLITRIKAVVQQLPHELSQKIGHTLAECENS